MNAQMNSAHSVKGRTVRTLDLAAIAASIALIAVSCWTVVPGPILPALILSVAIAELSAFALPFAGLLTIAIAALARGRARVIALTLSLTAVACIAWPLAAFPFSRSSASAALDAAGLPAWRSSNRTAFTVDRDLPVPLRGGGRLALDLYRPRGMSSHPLVVTVYGGAWAFGSRAAETGLASRWASRGYAVAVLDYRHAPGARFPAQLEDIEDGLRTIARRQREWHVDGSRVVLFGRSAGAQLALLAAERTQPLHVRGVVALYAPVDLKGGWETPPRPDPADVRTILETYLGGTPRMRADAYAAASPLLHVHTQMPGALLIIGDRDELVLPRFQRAFAAHLRAAGVPVVALELPWSNHAFDVVDGLGAAIADDAESRFIAAAVR